MPFVPTAFTEGTNAFHHGEKLTDNPYDANKAGASRIAASDWDHGWKTMQKKTPVVTNKITPGDQVADVDGHKPTWKSFLDWELTASETTREIFYGIHDNLESGKGDLLMNKMAYAVGSMTDVDGEVNSIMVVYRYDHTYHLGMMVSPKWKNRI